MDIAELIRKAKDYTTIDGERVKKAFRFAENAHAGQMRKNGDPYITHPFGVAMILVKYHADEESIIAALLHDVVEDTDHSLTEIEQQFGKPIAKMVDALTKLPQVNAELHGTPYQLDNKIESIRKIFEIMQDDVRVIVIKLCDRLHNMESLGSFRPDKQKRIAQETLDIFVRISDRLSIGELKESLEELCFKFLQPEAHTLQKQKEAKANDSFIKNRTSIEEKLLSLQKKIVKQLIFRSRLVYPQYKHLPYENAEIAHEIFLIVERDQDCFLALHGIHGLWNNIRGTFRDYITLPRSNGYQALWTSVVKSDGSILRFVIQTKDMYDYSRMGVMIKCFTPEGRGKKIKLPWVEHLKKIHENTKTKSDDYLSALESDILKGSIIVYTEDYKRIYLPPRSTALDAALHHLGNQAYKIDQITVDQNVVQFSHRLSDWQTINFHLSSQEQIGPKWLQLVQNSYSRSLIFEHLRTLPTQRRHCIAEELLQQEITDIGFGYLSEISLKRRQEVSKKLNCKSWSELLDEISAGRHSVHTIVRLLFEQEIVKAKRISATLQVRRDTGPDGISSIFSYLHENGIPFTHNSTRRVDSFFIDELNVDWSLIQRSRFFSYVKEFLHFDLKELRPLQKTIIPVAYAAAVPLLWALNTYVTRYLLQNGLSVENATELRFLSSTVILFILAFLIRRYYHEDYSPLKFSFSFFFIAAVLMIYTYLIHMTLFYTESINYIVPVSISFVFVGLFHAFMPFFSKKSLVPLITTTLLCLSSLFLLTQQNLTEGEFLGIGLACLVLFLHMTYNYFGNFYQQKYQVKSRSILLVASMFFLATIVFLPFISLDNLLSASPFVLIVAILNGFVTGGLSHFFFFESSKYLQHYKVTLLMSLMVVFTVIMGILWDQSINSINLLSAALMIGAYVVASRYEQRAQLRNSSSPQQLG